MESKSRCIQRRDGVVGRIGPKVLDSCIRSRAAGRQQGGSGGVAAAEAAERRRGGIEATYPLAHAIVLREMKMSDRF